MVVAGNSCFLLNEGCELLVAASCLVVGGCWYEAYSPDVATCFVFYFLDAFYDCVHQAKAAVAVFDVLDVTRPLSTTTRIKTVRSVCSTFTFARTRPSSITTRIKTQKHKS